MFSCVRFPLISKPCKLSDELDISKGFSFFFVFVFVFVVVVFVTLELKLLKHFCFQRQKEIYKAQHFKYPYLISRSKNV